VARTSSAVTYKNKQDSGVIRERKQVVIDRELEKLYKKTKSVSPAVILEAARSDIHPLHGYFEWDDSKAAEKYRLDQAMAMIMASKFVVVLKQSEAGPQVAHAQPEVRKLIPAFRGEGFKMRNEVLDDAEMHQAFVQRKKEALRSWCRSVVDVVEFAVLREKILSEIGGD
jgi:hypothetical protein